MPWQLLAENYLEAKLIDTHKRTVPMLIETMVNFGLNYSDYFVPGHDYDTDDLDRLLQEGCITHYCNKYNEFMVTEFLNM